MDSNEYSAIIALPFKNFSLNLKILGVLLEAMTNSLGEKKIPVFIDRCWKNIKIGSEIDFNINGFEVHRNFFDISFTKGGSKQMIELALGLLEDSRSQNKKVLIIVDKDTEAKVRRGLNKNGFVSGIFEIKVVA